jgi:hypothetical protein
MGQDRFKFVQDKQDNYGQNRTKRDILDKTGHSGQSWRKFVQDKFCPGQILPRSTPPTMATMGDMGMG